MTAIVEVLFTSTVALALGLPLVFFLVGPVVLAHDVQTFRSEGLNEIRMHARLGVPLIVWLSVLAILWLRLFRVGDLLEWFFD